MASKNGVSQSMRRRVMREDDYTCQFCGLVGWELRIKGPSARNACYTFPTKIDGVWLSIDHIVPRSRGGTSERTNLRVLCTTCNTRRGAPQTDVTHLSLPAPEEHW